MGTYVDSAGNNRHGFLRSKEGDNYTTLDVPGAIFTVAQGINNAGTIAGLYVDTNGQHGFVLSGGVYTTIHVDVNGDVAASTAIFSINAQGEIVGSYSDASGKQHGYVGTPIH